MIFKQKKSFNLIELIVVIVILAILSVSAFAALTKWLAKGRDATRLSDLQVLSKSLDVAYSYLGYYPIPDNFVKVHSGNKVYSYQGVFGNEVAKVVKEIEKPQVDPTDRSYYTYLTDYKQQKYQLVAMLENDSKEYYGYVSRAFAESDYEYRYPYSEGNKVGSLLTGDRTPIERIDGLACLNLKKNNNTYNLVSVDNFWEIGTGKDIIEGYHKLENFGSPVVKLCGGACSLLDFKFGNYNTYFSFNGIKSRSVIDSFDNLLVPGSLGKTGFILEVNQGRDIKSYYNIFFNDDYGYTQLVKVLKDKYNYYYVLGYYSKKIGYFYYNKLFIIKLNSSFNVQKVFLLTGYKINGNSYSTYNNIYALDMLIDNNFLYILGSAGYNAHHFVLKLDTNLNIVWKKGFNSSSSNNHSNGSLFLYNDKIYVFGLQPNYYPPYFIVMDKNNNILTGKSFDTLGSYKMKQGIVDNKGNLLIVFSKTDKSIIVKLTPDFKVDTAIGYDIGGNYIYTNDIKIGKLCDIYLVGSYYRETIWWTLYYNGYIIKLTSNFKKDFIKAVSYKRLYTVPSTFLYDISIDKLGYIYSMGKGLSYYYSGNILKMDIDGPGDESTSRYEFTDITNSNIFNFADESNNIVISNYNNNYDTYYDISEIYTGTLDVRIYKEDLNYTLLK